MQGQFTQVQRIDFRGADWLIFGLAPQSSRKRKRRGLLGSLQRERHCDLVLAAAIPHSVFSILFSQTVQVQPSQGPTPLTSQQSPLSAPTAEQSITTSLDFWSHWRNSTLGEDSAKIYIELSDLRGKASVNTPSSQEIIVISEDRASTVFHEWKDRIRSKSGWHTPLALGLTIISTLATASFEDHTWIKGGTLKGVFITTLVACLVWLAREIYRAAKSPSASASNFIADIKKGTKKTEYGIISNQEQ